MPPALGLFLVLPLVWALHRSDDNNNNNNVTHEFTINKSALAYSRNDHVYNFGGFTVTKILPEGEVRRVTRWNGICAKETIVDWGDTSVALREVTLDDSPRKLQLIYEGEKLADCTDAIATDREDSRCELDRETVSTRDNDDDDARMQIFEVETTTNHTATPELEWLASLRELRKRCDNVRTRSRNLLTIRRRHRRMERSLQQMVIAPGTKWCGPHRTANSYKELGALDHADRCCRRHDHCHRSIPPFSQLYNLWNYMPFTLSHCGCDQRRPRLLEQVTTGRTIRTMRDSRSRSRNKRELLLIPGTQWCGRGNRATKYTNLGGFGKADACCRRHDTACPFYIPAFETRYGLFNWGISTVMHCTCDERFRTCLKMAGTSSANFIGRIFFNVVQTKCFVLKPQKVCVRQSWWGKCEKHRYKKQAHLRDNVPY